MKSRPLLVLFITIFLDLVGFGIIIPILPLYADELGASGFMIGLIGASFSFTQFLFAPFWGGLSDRIGRRPVLLISISIVALSYLIIANAFSIFLLLLARVIAGIGAANISTANAFISDISTPEKRAKNFGIIGAAFGMGFIFGPPLGGLLKAHYGIEGVGYVAALLSGGNVLLAIFMLPESLREKNSDSPLFPNPLKELWSVVPRPEIRSYLLIQFVFVGAFSMMTITASLLWSDKFGLSEAEVGYVFAYIGVLVVIIQGGLIGKLTARFGERPLFITGNLLMAIGLASMPLTPASLFIPLELTGLVFISFGQAFFTPTLSSLLSENAGSHERGKILGLSQSVAALARVAGPLLGGFFYGLHLYLPFLAASGTMLLTASMAYRIVKKGI